MPTRDPTGIALLRRVGRVIAPGLPHGWQRRTARAIGVDDTTVSDILNGARRMSDKVRKRAERVLEREQAT